MPLAIVFAILFKIIDRSRITNSSLKWCRSTDLVSENWGLLSFLKGLLTSTRSIVSNCAGLSVVAIAKERLSTIPLEANSAKIDSSSSGFSAI